MISTKHYKGENRSRLLILIIKHFINMKKMIRTQYGKSQDRDMKLKFFSGPYWTFFSADSSNVGLVDSVFWILSPACTIFTFLLYITWSVMNLSTLLILETVPHSSSKFCQTSTVLNLLLFLHSDLLLS